MRFSLPFFSEVNDLDEVVFEHRNKAYGAYELRQHYNERLQQAFLITLSFIAVPMMLVILLQHRKPPIVIPPPVIEHYVGGAPQIEPAQKKTVQEVPRQQPLPEKQSMIVMKDSTQLPSTNIDTSTSASPAGNNANGNSNNPSSDGGVASDSGGVSSIPPEKKQDEEIKSYATVMPSFPGGPKALAKYLGREIDCNESGRNGFSHEGKIILKFAVMKDGSIRDITVLQETVSIDCVDQAKQILLNGPKWNPGMENNEAVNVMVVQPITLVVE